MAQADQLREQDRIIAETEARVGRALQENQHQNLTHENQQLYKQVSEQL